MNNIYKAVIRTKTSYLVHYNPNHDKLGRFAKSNSRNIPVVSKYISEMKDLKEKGVLGKYKSEMKDLKEKGVWGKYKSDVKEIITGPKKDESHNNSLVNDHQKDNVNKNIIPVDIKQTTEIFGKAKITKDQHKCSAFEGDATAYKWENDSSIDVQGKSSTKTYKIETKSKDGVHLINSYKTDISFSDVGTSDGKAIDKHKLKELNDYSMSRESRKALDAGKKMASTQYLDTYKDWSSDPISRKLPDKYNNDNFYRDLYPQSINYKKNKKTKKPEIGVVCFVDKYDNFSGHVLGVYYEDGIPKTVMLEG